MSTDYVITYCTGITWMWNRLQFLTHTVYVAHWPDPPGGLGMHQPSLYWGSAEYHRGRFYGGSPTHAAAAGCSLSHCLHHHHHLNPPPHHLNRRRVFLWAEGVEVKVNCISQKKNVKKNYWNINVFSLKHNMLYFTFLSMSWSC